MATLDSYGKPTNKFTAPSGRYKEIFKLKKMLEDADIMFDWTPHFGYLEDLLDKYPELTEHYQICYPIFDPDHRLVSVIEGFGTHGAENDKLEIMLNSPLKEAFSSFDDKEDVVIGHLTAETVFEIIKEHWDSCHNG